MEPLMQLLAPALLAALFVLFGLSHRGRAPGSCGSCTNGCEKKAGATGCESKAGEK